MFSWFFASMGKWTFGRGRLDTYILAILHSCNLAILQDMLP